MSYKLKKIRFRNQDHYILLQNENGPCPLLAAANVLLLRGSIRLPDQCIHVGTATLDNVCNVLAEHAISSSGSSNFHLNELLELFPTLQDGMDVNPKFTEGPTGYEYTTQMSAFDMLQIKLVHGWLLDSEANELLYKYAKNRTYNELLDLVIRGQEAQTKLTMTLIPKVSELEAESSQKKKEDGDKVVNNDELVVTTIQINSKTEIENIETRLEQTINKLKEECQTLSEEATRGALVDEFLRSTSHQLTQFGLGELLNSSDFPKVFFRNNHFGTITCQDGVLYLLVTDLGYGSVPEIVWEKLDNIDGNTQYVTHDFSTSKVMGHLAGGRMPDSLQSYLDAHPNPIEAMDFLLALSLENSTTNGTNTIPEDDEAAQLAAATEASLKEYNKGATVAVIGETLDTCYYIADIAAHPQAAALKEAYNIMARRHNDAASLALVEQLEQKQVDPSLSLAKRLQEEEYRRQAPRPAPAESSCVIS